jgi:hypothetical protein
MNLMEEYINVLSEGKGSKQGHSSPSFDNLIKKLDSLGFEIKISDKGVYRISPPEHIKKTLPTNLQIYNAHKGDKGFHPVRRWAENYCKVDLKM